MATTTNRKLHKLDATDIAPGRLATKIALLLRGKNKTDYTPHIDNGDIVEVSNARLLKFTGKKIDQKQYFNYSGYPGGMKVKKMKQLMETDPAEVLRKAVREMLPGNRTRAAMLKRLIIR
jgi:large subunit ribosomal protein L13